MNSKYDYKNIEKKWQDIWEKENLFCAKNKTWRRWIWYNFHAWEKRLQSSFTNLSEDLLGKESYDPGHHERCRKEHIDRRYPSSASAGRL